VAHRAADAGQMSLFGDAAVGVGLSTMGALPPIDEAPLRERLEWEKELIGVYISEHPVARALTQLRDTVTHLCGEIGEDHHDQKVTVLGLVTAYRSTLTKKGDQMAFVTLEDIQGTVDVVVFPRTWKQTQAMWQRDKIVVVRGKVDARGRRPSIICDSVSDNLDVVQPSDSAKPAPPEARDDSRRPAAGPTQKLNEARAEYPSPRSTKPPQPLIRAPSSGPGPAQPSAAVPAPPRAQSAAPRPPDRDAAPNGERAGPARPIAPRYLRVTIQRSGDGRSDARRVGDVHRLLQSFSGYDRFVFYVTGGGNGNYELDFPNDTTLICDELLARLRNMLGSQAVNLIE
jgi:DNA polymerase-3 subunit alpha